MFLPARHPQGHYAKWPEVTWDIAEERWLMGRTAVLSANCPECLWEDAQLVLNTPERILVAEVVASLAHGYSCDYDLRFFPYITAKGHAPNVVDEEDL